MRTKKNDVFSKILSRAIDSGKRIVLPEGSDPRVIEAAKKASLMNLCHVIVLGNETLLSESFSKKELRNISKNGKKIN